MRLFFLGSSVWLRLFVSVPVLCQLPHDERSRQPLLLLQHPAGVPSIPGHDCRLRLGLHARRPPRHRRLSRSQRPQKRTLILITIRKQLIQIHTYIIQPMSSPLVVAFGAYVKGNGRSLR